jgi:DNA-nicking Smr family endonuclease
MKRPLKPDELKVWGMVAATVHPLPGKQAPELPTDPDRAPSPLWGGSSREASGVGKSGSSAKAAPSPITPTRPGLRPVHPPHKGEGVGIIEPRRRHRIAKAREEIGARLDLHGLDQVRAKAVLEGFVRRAWDEGYRAVLVITGKGVQGDGILKRRVPEWLGAPHLVTIVAGISDAARHHGGEGALYVALKRKTRS